MGAVAMVLAASGAAAQSDDASARAAARALFEEGVAHTDRGEWAEAADRFERAYRLRSSPVIANNLAMTYVELGRFVEASEMLQTVARDETADRGVRSAAESQLETVLARTGRLTIRLQGPRDGVTLGVDGRPLDLAVLGTPIPADPGTREITAHRGDEQVAAGRAEVTTGAEAEVTLIVPALPEIEASAHAERGPFDSTLAPVDDESGTVLGQWWFWAVLGVAVAGGVVAGIALGSPGGTDPVAGNLGTVGVP